MLACGHDEVTEMFGVCAHVRGGADHLERFTGRGIDCDLICTSCNAPGIEAEWRRRRSRLRSREPDRGYAGRNRSDCYDIYLWS